MLLLVMRPDAPSIRCLWRALPTFLLGTVLAACSPTPPVRPPPTQPPPPPARVTTRAPATVKLGVIVPAGGAEYLQQYSEAVLEGIRVAAEQHNATGDYRVQLEVRSAATAADAAAAVRDLSAQGVHGIIGPLLDTNVAAAAAARPDTTLVIVSPTAASPYRALPNVYALNVPDTLGAYALGGYAARAALAPVAVLRARSGPAVAQAGAFLDGLLKAAGQAPLEVTFAPGTTNFGTSLRRLRNARVRSVFVAAEEGDLRQLLPQLGYYGLGSAQILAAGSWATPDGLDRIGLPALNGVITTLPFLPADSAGTWARFERAYEALNRRSLESAIPALGYDAASLVLSTPSGDAARLSSRLRAGDEVTGATGRLLPLQGSIGRQPVLVRIVAGRLVPVVDQ